MVTNSTLVSPVYPRGDVVHYEVNHNVELSYFLWCFGGLNHTFFFHRIAVRPTSRKEHQYHQNYQDHENSLKVGEAHATLGIRVCILSMLVDGRLLLMPVCVIFFSISRLVIFFSISGVRIRVL